MARTLSANIIRFFVPGDVDHSAKEKGARVEPTRNEFAPRSAT